MDMDNTRLCKKDFLWDYEISTNNWSSLNGIDTTKAFITPNRRAVVRHMHNAGTVQLFVSL
jgi:hypothetical protein